MCMFVHAVKIGYYFLSCWFGDFDSKMWFGHNVVSSFSTIAEQCERGESRVLVHCMPGKNRSAAVVTAFLMKSRGWRLAPSLHWVKDRRPQVQITEGSQCQLVEYEQKLFGPSAGSPAQTTIFSMFDGHDRGVMFLYLLGFDRTRSLGPWYSWYCLLALTGASYIWRCNPCLFLIYYLCGISYLLKYLAECLVKSLNNNTLNSSNKDSLNKCMCNRIHVLCWEIDKKIITYIVFLPSGFKISNVWRWYYFSVLCANQEIILFLLWECIALFSICKLQTLLILGIGVIESMDQI